jgi:hypothetical protein
MNSAKMPIQVSPTTRDFPLSTVESESLPLQPTTRIRGRLYQRSIKLRNEGQTLSNHGFWTRDLLSSHVLTQVRAMKQQIVHVQKTRYNARKAVGVPMAASVASEDAAAFRRTDYVQTRSVHVFWQIGSVTQTYVESVVSLMFSTLSIVIKKGNG